ncbi:hypothetical protein HDU82_000583 [Entophlyctis luteolus]|nr:hypothetical protein HDU82_000583 [Entophlyctis luteolus]
MLNYRVYRPTTNSVILFLTICLILQSDSVFESLLEQCLYEVVLDNHRDIQKPGMDIFGNNHSSVNSEKLKCVKCGILFPTIRYAQHLEKCLGLGGRRAAVRNVNRRMATNQSSSSSPNLNESEDDYPLRDKSTWILLLIYYLLNLTIVQKNVR